MVTSLIEDNEILKNDNKDLTENVENLTKHHMELKEQTENS